MSNELLNRPAHMAGVYGTYFLPLFPVVYDQKI